MDAKKMLFFIGRCLSLSVHSEREAEIRKLLHSGDVNWEAMVWIGSNQYVLPALFVQFRNYNLLSELPADLVDYLEEIYQLNLARNTSVLEETWQIIALLNSIGIAPVFLKGTAHLLEGLYTDIGERMIGDIDFLVAEQEVLPAVAELKKRGYYNLNERRGGQLLINKHYPRLQNEKTVAAVEIHHQLVSKPYSKKFDAQFLDSEKKRLNVAGEAYVLSDYHQIIHNMMNAQMNDKAFKLRKILMRNAYDLQLLAGRKNPLDCILDFKYYQKELNVFLCVVARVFDTEIAYINNAAAKRYFNQLLFYNNHPRFYKMNEIVHFLLYRLGRYIKLPIIAIYNRGEREALVGKLSDWKWYFEHLKSWRSISY
nr:nucleotidyltransferase family protein [uncultured Draconibacterium sp.]